MIKKETLENIAVNILHVINVVITGLFLMSTLPKGSKFIIKM